ncbi:hypothetical protein PLANPX_6194 [Lacipirellula parvula]|uniref:Uncharacterized protein n=1 Tax=Lacipirellula parvula TaxID=2650471 RepID=A0A5K7XK81_9BACT|nr:hypothetical protein PLANPX_6194 [Lacipirellula parvula]
MFVSIGIQNAWGEIGQWKSLSLYQASRGRGNPRNVNKITEISAGNREMIATIE